MNIWPDQKYVEKQRRVRLDWQSEQAKNLPDGQRRGAGCLTRETFILLHWFSAPLTVIRFGVRFPLSRFSVDLVFFKACEVACMWLSLFSCCLARCNVMWCDVVDGMSCKVSERNVTVRKVI